MVCVYAGGSKKEENIQMKKSLELVRAKRQMLNLLLGRYCSGFIN